MDPASTETARLVAWVHSLSRDLGLVESMGVYNGRSTVVLFHGPYQLWAQVNGLPGFSFVCEVFSRNLLENIRRREEDEDEDEVQPGPPSRSQPDRKENM